MSGQSDAIEFPDEFIQYSKETLLTKRDTIEYDARFGPPVLKEWARMVLAAGGETWNG